MVIVCAEFRGPACLAIPARDRPRHFLGSIRETKQMTVSYFVRYDGAPADPAAFDRHYAGPHAE
ncbi:MAG: hypothetical protein O7I42_08675, partial [Alphaproteobacteria bacterium]|nr:hypothetical protein [Alphaproteobacteria bacterium]